jgi:hypothetical protein
MRLDMHEDGKVENITLSDVRTGENPWNWARDFIDSSSLAGHPAYLKSNLKFSTREKVVIQPPSSVSAAVMTGEHLMTSNLV